MNLDYAFLGQTVLALSALLALAKGASWLMGRDEREAKEQTRRSIETQTQALQELVQVMRENKAISTETRSLVRDLEKAGILSAEADRQMAGVLTKLEAAFSNMASAISELVGELRASRKNGQ